MRNARRRLRTLRGIPAPLLLLLFPSIAILAAGCSDDDSTPVCDLCESWSQLTAGLGRFPEPHPVNPDFIAYSTIEKDRSAPDGTLDSDEDLWLLWVLDPHDPAQNIHYQLTFGELGPGDNFNPRWSPSGTQIAFTHTSAAGDFEIWRLDVTLPAGPQNPPVLGVPELVAPDARDPAWLDETTVMFTRNDKLYRTSPRGARGGTSEEQLTYSPPTYASTEKYIDRHPTVSPDGEILFNTMNRQPVADLLLETFEIDNLVSGDTTVAEMGDGKGAWVLYQPPGAPNPSYPILESGQIVRTPVLLQSIPVGEGGVFRIGTKIDRNLLDLDTAPEDSLRETYCDTTLIGEVELLPGDSDTLRTYFQVVRGSLRVTTGRPNTAIFWQREDLNESSNDYGLLPNLPNAGSFNQYNCVFSHDISGGEPNVPLLETFLVAGSSGADADTAFVTVPPGTTTVVRLLPSAPVTGTVAYSDNPPDRPRVDVVAFRDDTADTFAIGQTPPLSREFRVSNLIEGRYDLLLTSPRYDSTRVENVDIVADSILAGGHVNSVTGVHVGIVPFNALPTGAIGGTLTFSDLPVPFPVCSLVVFVADTEDSAGFAVTDSTDPSFVVDRLLEGAYDLFFTCPGYSDLTLEEVAVTPPDTTDLGTVELTAGLERSYRLARYRREAHLRDRLPVSDRDSGQPPTRRWGSRTTPSPVGGGTALSSLFRAAGDLATLWRIRLGEDGSIDLQEILGSPTMIQSPALTENVGGAGEDRRYVAYVSTDLGVSELYIQPLRNWQPDGDPILVPTPGTSDNFACRRSIFHPRWVPSSAGQGHRLVVAMGGCPDNEFEDLEAGDPWAVGEMRIWEVNVDLP
jgi:hypothetical protein